MNFRTEVIPPPALFNLTHNHLMMAMGSCFVENIGNLLQQNKFNLILNPFGVLYNPFSISKALNLLLEKQPILESELFCHHEVWAHFAFHSRFASPDKNEALKNMRKSLEQAQQRIMSADVLLFTFGTAWVYRLKKNNDIVANCHKVPADEFLHQLLNPDQISEEMTQTLKKIYEINPGIKFIFTISPVRHWKDGPSQNQTSKSILFVALNRILSHFDNAYYFPSYEMMMDDLRDYRFYAADMIHPNQQAIQYIWSRFSEVFFNAGTRSLMKEIQGIQKAAAHRPFNPETTKHQEFIKVQLNKIDHLTMQYPKLNFEEEIDLFKKQLKG